MKRWWLCVVSLLLLAACSDEIPETPKLQVKGRTMLSYIVSSDLDNYLKANVIDMYKGLSARKDSTTLLIFYSPSSRDISLDGPSILKFVADGKGKINGENIIPLTELEVRDKKYCTDAPRKADPIIRQAIVFPSHNSDENATDPQVMERILKEMTKIAPSDSYGLVMGSHGTGWIEGKPVNNRSFGEEDGYNINIPELGLVLKNAFSGNKLDFILFDACMMANAEVAYELRDVTDYMIASVLESPALGFPYLSFFDQLYEEKVDYQFICDQFVEVNRKNDSWGTVAAVDCSKMQMLADWVKEALANTYPQWQGDYFEKVQQYGHGHFKYFSFDVVDFFRQLNGEAPSDLLQIMNQVVIAKNCLSGPEHKFGNLEIEGDKFCGIGMYIPYLFSSETYRKNWDEYYESSIAWYNAVEWMNYRP